LDFISEYLKNNLTGKKDKKMGIQDHPRFSTIQTWIDQVLINITNAQATYFAKNQKFFQGLKIPSQGKLDGNSEALIDYGLHPEDQTDSWNTFEKAKFKENVKFPCHLKLDVYESPRGWGWVVSFHLYVEGLGPDTYGNDGDHWVYQHNEGPSIRSGIFDDWFILEETDD
jgi:hypothetical protein